jgi:nitrate reductase gamma subunit
MNSDIKGNSCIYFLFQVSNFCIFFLGVATIAIGIYVCITAGDFMWYNGSFIGLGIVTFLTGFLGWKAKYSTFRLTLYLVFIFGCLLVQSGFTIAVIAWDFSDVVNGENNANPVRYTLIACCGLLLLCLVTGFFYRRSLSSRITVPYKPLKPEKTTAPEPAYKSKYDQVKERTKNMT